MEVSGEALAQHRVLGGDADRTGIEMALAHHDAAGRNQGRGGEALDDILGRFLLVERHRLALVFLGGLDLEQAAERQQPLGLLVEDFCKRPVAFQRIAAHRVL